MSWFSRRAGRPPRRDAPRALSAGERERALRGALEAVLDGDSAEAERHLSELVLADSRDVDLYLLLGRLFRHSGQIGRAIRIHQNLLLRADVDGTHRVQALRELGEDFRDGGFLQRAAASYEEAREYAPGDPRVLRPLAEIYEALGRHAEAVDASRRLARVEHTARAERGAVESRLWTRMAELEREAGRHAESRKAVKRAIQRDAGNVDARILLGDLEVERGRSKAALAAWKEVPNLDRRRGPEVFQRLAAAFAAVGKPRNFEALLQDLLQRDSRDSGARIALARALAARGEVDDALGELRRVLDQEPRNLPARALRGRLLLGENRQPDAAKELAELLEVIESDDPSADSSADSSEEGV